MEGKPLPEYGDPCQLEKPVGSFSGTTCQKVDNRFQGLDRDGNHEEKKEKREGRNVESLDTVNKHEPSDKKYQDREHRESKMAALTEPQVVRFPDPEK